LLRPISSGIRPPVRGKRLMRRKIRLGKRQVKSLDQVETLVEYLLALPPRSKIAYTVPFMDMIQHIKPILHEQLNDENILFRWKNPVTLRVIEKIHHRPWWDVECKPKETRSQPLNHTIHFISTATGRAEERLQGFHNVVHGYEWNYREVDIELVVDQEK
jgi:hypothetical protein